MQDSPPPVALVASTALPSVCTEDVGRLLVRKEIELLLALSEQVLEAEVLWTPTDFSETDPAPVSPCTISGSWYSNPLFTR